MAGTQVQTVAADCKCVNLDELHVEAARIELQAAKSMLEMALSVTEDLLSGEVGHGSVPALEFLFGITSGLGVRFDQVQYLVHEPATDE